MRKRAVVEFLPGQIDIFEIHIGKRPGPEIGFVHNFLCDSLSNCLFITYVFRTMILFCQDYGFAALGRTSLQFKHNFTVNPISSLFQEHFPKGRLIEPYYPCRIESMSNDAPIAFLDSGVGGLPYLQWVKEKLPLENFIYFADRKNFPYGEKSREEIVQIVLDTVKSLHNGNSPKMLVIACNTASVTSLDAVREAVDIPVVGVVPAVKPAAEISTGSRIGVLATERTVSGTYLQRLIDDFASTCHVEKVGASGIVRFVENNLFSSSEREKNEILDQAVNRFTGQEVDTVVLGCTHFIYIDELLKKRLGPKVRVIDSREGVGNQIIKVLTDKNMLSLSKRDDYFYCSEEPEEGTYSQFASMFGLHYQGIPEDT